MASNNGQRRPQTQEEVDAERDAARREALKEQVRLAPAKAILEWAAAQRAARGETGSPST